MKAIIDAYHIAQFYLRRQLSSPALWSFFLMGIAFTFAVKWNDEASTLEFAGLNLGMGGSNGRFWSLKYAFYDLFIAGWIVVVFFVFNKVLMPVTTSYMVSQSLWLRLASTNNTTLVISRIFQVFSATGLVFFISLIWVLAYSFRHQIGFHELVAAVYGASGYVLLSGGIIILLSGKPTTGIERRYAFVVLAMSIPVLLYLIGKNANVIRRFDGFFPYALPLGLKDTTFESVRAYKTAGMIGAIFMAVSLLKSIFMSSLKQRRI